jgi:hypothetical protein
LYQTIIDKAGNHLFDNSIEKMIPRFVYGDALESGILV